MMNHTPNPDKPTGDFSFAKSRWLLINDGIKLCDEVDVYSANIRFDSKSDQLFTVLNELLEGTVAACAPLFQHVVNSYRFMIQELRQAIDRRESWRLTSIRRILEIEAEIWAFACKNVA